MCEVSLSANKLTLGIFPYFCCPVSFFFLIAFVVKTVTIWLLLEVTEHAKLGQHLCQQQVLLGTARRFLPLLKEIFDNWWRMDGCLSLCTNCPLCVQTFNIELWGTVQCKADIILNNGNSLGLTKHYRSWTDKYMIYTIYNHKLKLLLYTIYQWPAYK